MTEIPDRLRRLLDVLSGIEDRNERIQLLIDFAERFRGVPERIAKRPFSKGNLIPGCESEAYAWAEELVDGTLRFHFAVLNPQGVSAKALAVILDEGLSGEAPERVAAVSTDVVYTIFGRELSMGKTMGLTGMVGRIASLARRHAAKMKQVPDT